MRQRRQTRRGGTRPHQLYAAAKRGDLEQVKHLIDQKQNINSFAKTVDNGGVSEMTPVQIAALKGHVDVVRYLKEHGADVTSNDRITGETFLILAVKSKSADMVSYVLGLGFDVNEPASNGIRRTPIFYANEDTLSVLISHGADMTIKDGMGKTIEDYPSKKGLKSVLRQYESKRSTLKNIPSASMIRNLPMQGDLKIQMYKHFGGCRTKRRRR